MFNWTGQVSDKIRELYQYLNKVNNFSYWHADHQVARILQRRFLEAFEYYRKDFLTSCSQEGTAADIPVTVKNLINILTFPGLFPYF